MKTNTFRVVTSISTVLALTAAVFSLVGIPLTGLYPGIIVLWMVALTALFTKLSASKIGDRTPRYQRNYYRIFTVINFLLILVTLWMAFVILHDRVLQDCC